jgi:hypothetical protein
MSTPHEFTVTVTYNGLDHVVEYKPEAAVQALLEHAKQAFAAQGQHLLGLFTEAGIELNDAQSAVHAGVVPGMLLVLRQSTVRGGS